MAALLAVRSATDSTWTFPGDDLCTGTRSDEFSNPPAYFSDVQVYDRALTAAQIAVLAAQ